MQTGELRFDLALAPWSDVAHPGCGGARGLESAGRPRRWGAREAGRPAGFIRRDLCIADLTLGLACIRSAAAQGHRHQLIGRQLPAADAFDDVGALCCRARIELRPAGQTPDRFTFGALRRQSGVEPGPGQQREQ